MIDDRTIKSARPGNRFMVSVYPLRVQTVTVEDWLAKLAMRSDIEDIAEQLFDKRCSLSIDPILGL